MAAQPYKILLVDDDDICAMGLKRAMRRLDLPNTFYIANDGIEALELLRGNDNASPVETPYLVLLDLDMPRMSGHEFLREVRSDPRLSKKVVFRVDDVSRRDGQSIRLRQEYSGIYRQIRRRTDLPERARHASSIIARLWSCHAER